MDFAGRTKALTQQRLLPPRGACRAYGVCLQACVAARRRSEASTSRRPHVCSPPPPLQLAPVSSSGGASISTLRLGSRSSGVARRSK
ncbi:hypothetical protein VTN02DRAFT_4508 [Thermoascus thermophilus]